MSQQINLFNPAFEPQRNVFAARPIAIALGVLALGLAALAGVAEVRVAGLQADAKASAQRLAQAQSRLTQASAEFAPRKPSPELEAQIAQAETRLAAMQKVESVVARGALGNTQGFAETFRALARQGVQGLWLTGVSVAGPNEIGVRGRALDAALVPGYIGRLANEPVMRGKTIGSLVIDNGEARGDKDVKDVKDDKAAAQGAYVDFQFQSAPAAQEDKR